MWKMQKDISALDKSMAWKIERYRERAVHGVGHCNGRTIKLLVLRRNTRLHAARVCLSSPFFSFSHFRIARSSAPKWSHLTHSLSDPRKSHFISLHSLTRSLRMHQSPKLRLVVSFLLSQNRKTVRRHGSRRTTGRSFGITSFLLSLGEDGAHDSGFV